MPLSEIFLAKKFTSLTSFFSVSYLVFFLPAAIVLYALLPKRGRRCVLLLLSYAFYWLVSGKLIVFLLLSTVSTHYFGIWLDRMQTAGKAAIKLLEDKEEKKRARRKLLLRQRGVVFFACALLLGCLLVIKYGPFFTTNVNFLIRLLRRRFSLAVPHYLLPLGISFFTLQALSYILDVYHGTVKADDNLFRLALFMSFFPQIVEGPICRYSQTAQPLWDAPKLRFENLQLGAQRILYGLMKKLIIADRLNPLVNTVFSNHTAYEGGVIALAAVCYTVQLYMDFSGSMDAVMGIGQIFGVTMPENFARPFFSKSISDFWTRWHITLGAWFRDYIFYPVSMAKPMKKLTSSARKILGNHYGPLLASIVALLCVWVCNGLWHGAAWHYIFFGLYHFALILCGNIFEPGVRFLQKKLHIRPDSVPYRGMQIVRTAVLVVIGELFFRADNLRIGFGMFGKMVTDFRFGTVSPSLLAALGTDYLDMIVVAVGIALVLTVSILNERGHSVRALIARRPTAVRWLIWYALILFIVIFGAYGPGYTPVDPMYANF